MSFGSVCLYFFLQNISINNLRDTLNVGIFNCSIVTLTLEIVKCDRF